MSNGKQSSFTIFKMFARQKTPAEKDAEKKRVLPKSERQDGGHVTKEYGGRQECQRELDPFLC